jgi:hypothetical protein
MKILSWNLFWKAITGKAKYCKINKCLNNIAIIIYNCILLQYDFLAFQEINESQYYQYLLPILTILDKDNKLLSNYTPVFGSFRSSGVITLYNNKYVFLHTVYYKLSNVYSNESRPFQIIFFKNKLIYINVHMPHADKNNRRWNNKYNNINSNIIEIFDKLLEIISINELKLYRIILGGDFNTNNPYKCYNLKQFGFNNNNFNKLTCCYLEGFGYLTKSYDHVFSTFGNIKINTLSKKYIKNMTENSIQSSDHLPISITIL